MFDNFKEEIVTSRHTAFSSVLYVLAWIMMAFFAVIAVWSLQMVFLMFSFATVLVFLASGGAAVVLFIFKDYLKIEYEYAFTNGVLDFARVFRNARRKELGSMNVQNVTACGHVAHDSFQRFLSMKGVDKKNWFLNRDGNLFYFYYVKNEEKHMIIIEPTEELVGMIRNYLPVGVYQG